MRAAPQISSALSHPVSLFSLYRFRLGALAALGLVAIALPWISFDFALNVLLLGTALVLPWAAWASVQRAREAASTLPQGDAPGSARPRRLIAGDVIVAALELVVAITSLVQFAVNMGWLQPMG